MNCNILSLTIIAAAALVLQPVEAFAWGCSRSFSGGGYHYGGSAEYHGGYGGGYHYGGYGGAHYGGCYGGGFAAGAVTGAAVGTAAATAAYYNQYPTGVYYRPVY